MIGFGGVRLTVTVAVGLLAVGESAISIACSINARTRCFRARRTCWPALNKPPPAPLQPAVMASHSSISAIAMSMASMMPVDPSAMSEQGPVVVVQRGDEGLCCLCLAAQGVCNRVSAHPCVPDGVEVFGPPEFSMESLGSRPRKAVSASSFRSKRAPRCGSARRGKSAPATFRERRPKDIFQAGRIVGVRGAISVVLFQRRDAGLKFDCPRDCR